MAYICKIETRLYSKIICMLPNDLFVHLFGFFIAHGAAMHSKKSLNLIKNIYLVSLQNIMELSLIVRGNLLNLGNF